MRQKHYFWQTTKCSEQKFTPLKIFYTDDIRASVTNCMSVHYTTIHYTYTTPPTYVCSYVLHEMFPHVLQLLLVSQPGREASRHLGHVEQHGTHGTSWDTWNIMGHVEHHVTHGTSWDTWNIM